MGIISGLTPGLHPNLFGKYLTVYSAVAAIIFYQYFSHLREIFLMVPDENSVLSLHPIYKMYKAGWGFKALLLSNLGVLISSLIAFVLLEPVIILISNIYEISKTVGWILLFASLIITIITERNKINGLIIIVISGILGLLSLPHGITPMLSGLFATTILISKGKYFVKQNIDWRVKISKKAILFGFLSSLFLVLTPAIGPTQSAIIAKSFTNDEEFIFSMGIIRGFDIIFAIIMILTFGYSRNGTLNQAHITIAQNEIYPMIAYAVGLSFLAFIFSTELGVILSKININLEKIKFVSLLLLIVISFFSDGITGVMIFSVASVIGILAEKMKVRRINLMGSLMIPSLAKKFI